MIYGYIRVSTDKQTVENQRFEINKYCKANKICIEHWIEEVISSRVSLKNRELGNLLKKLRKGDILIASELSRFGRNLLEVMSILQTCLEKGCQIWTIKENYKLGTDIGSKVLAFAFSLTAEIERQMISARTIEAMQRLKSSGQHIGRPFTSKSAIIDLKNNKDIIVNLAGRQCPKSQLARMFNVSRWTISKLLQDPNYLQLA